MKTIGIIGGIGPQATMAFEAYLHEASRRSIPAKANSGYPPLWVRYIRGAPIRLNPDGTPVVPFEPSLTLLDSARTLGGLCDFLVITSNSPHVFINEIQEAAQKPVVNMLELVVSEIKKKGYKKVGIMGISGSLRNGLYEKPLTREGIVSETMTLEIGSRLDTAIFRVMEGVVDEDGKRVAREGLQFLRDRQCDAIILGCTEIPFLLADEVRAGDLIDPLKLLAEEAVKLSIDAN
jgi:aspartate racemase